MIQPSENNQSGASMDGRISTGDLFFQECPDLLCILELAEGGGDLCFQQVNNAFVEGLGWSTDDLAGTLFTALISHQAENIKEADDSSAKRFRIAESESLALIKGTTERISVEEEFRCKDGSCRWISWIIKRVESRQVMFFGNGRDISERKRKECEIEASERRLKESHQIAGLGQWDLDLKSNELIWSSEIFRLFHIDPSQFGASYEAFLNAIHPDDREMVNSAYLSHLESRKPYKIIHRLLLPNNQIKWVVENCRSEYDLDGTPLRSIGTVQDITDLKQAQEDAKIAQEKAEAADRLKSTFLANMSHEIRTPMNAVLGFTDLMLAESNSVDKAHLDYLETINTSGKLLLCLINDILDISKIEAGQLELEKKSFSLRKVVKTVENNARGLITRKGSNLEFKTPEIINEGANFHGDIADMIVADPQRLQQILNNLLSNAIKFTEFGTVQYKIHKKMKPQGSPLLEFTVSDTGVGIPMDKQQDIFEPFRQSNNTGNANNTLGGTGLGLSIARKLVEGMGGEIDLESSTAPENHGSIFRFTIPYVPAESAKTSSSRASFSQKVGSISLPNLRGKVLIVDDNIVNLKLADRFIQKMGAVTTTAENGSVAIAKYQSDPSIQVILMDKEMPVMCGLTAVRRIREWEVQEGKSRIPIVAVTAAAMVGDRQECIDAGCDEYITKPLNRTALHMVLSNFIAAKP